MTMLADAELQTSPSSESGGAAPFALGVMSSFGGRPWRFRVRDDDVVRGLSLSGISGPLAQILASRGVTRETAASFLDPRLKTLLPEPFLIAHMERAVSRFT